jgi:hypothetical protein
MMRDRYVTFSAFTWRWLSGGAAFAIWMSASSVAADTISGQVFGAGAPITSSTVTLWAESASAYDAPYHALLGPAADRFTQAANRCSCLG